MHDPIRDSAAVCSVVHGAAANLWSQGVLDRGNQQEKKWKGVYSVLNENMLPESTTEQPTVLSD